MKKLSNATIEELEDEILKRKLEVMKREEKIDFKYEKIKVNALGHCVIHWMKKSGGGSSLAVFGQYRCGERWFICSNWTGDKDIMTVATLREYVDSIKSIQQIRKYINS